MVSTNLLNPLASFQLSFESRSRKVATLSLAALFEKHQQQRLEELQNQRHPQKRPTPDADMIENPHTVATPLPATAADDVTCEQAADATADEYPLTGSELITRARSQEKDPSASANKKNFLTRIFRRKPNTSGDTRYQPMKDSDSTDDHAIDDVTGSRQPDVTKREEQRVPLEYDVTQGGDGDEKDIIDRKSSSSAKFFSKIMTSSSTAPRDKSTSLGRKLTPGDAKLIQQAHEGNLEALLFLEQDLSDDHNTCYQTLDYYTSDSDNDVAERAPAIAREAEVTSKRAVKKDGLKFKLMGKSQRVNNTQKNQDSNSKYAPFDADDVIMDDPKATPAHEHAQVARLRDMSGCENEAFRTSFSQGSIRDSSSAELLSSRTHSQKPADDGETNPCSTQNIELPPENFTHPVVITFHSCTIYTNQDTEKPSIFCFNTTSM